MTTYNELTPQEHRVLELVAMGWRNTKIASELCISTRTVEGHLYRIFDKLGVASRTDAAVLMFHKGSLLTTKMSGISDDNLQPNRYARDIH